MADFKYKSINLQLFGEEVMEGRLEGSCGVLATDVDCIDVSW